MKIRNGFVSNSSSSSFCILGLSFDKDTIIKKFNDKVFNLDSEEFSYLYDVGDKLIANTNLKCCVGISVYEDELVVGIPSDEIESTYSNKSINQIKREVAEEMNKAWNTSIKADEITFITDGGWDG